MTRTREEFEAREREMKQRAALRQAEQAERQDFYNRVQATRRQIEGGATFAPPSRLGAHYAGRREQEQAERRQQKRESNQRGAAWAAHMRMTPAAHQAWKEQYFAKLNDEVE